MSFSGDHTTSNIYDYDADEVVYNNNQSAAYNYQNLSGYERIESDQINSASSIANDLLALASSRNSRIVSSDVSSGYSSVYLSEVESAILRSVNPLEISETELITVLGNRGIWLNRAEVNSWRGDLPITAYVINDDPNPEIVTKKVALNLEYVQELAIRYLRPPTPPAPGEIIIKQQPNIPTAPAPPLIIRQQPARPATPEPLVIREAPPQPPATVGRKFITISGKRIPPPPRKVVIERLPQLPAKPQAVFIERWLPYAEVKRRVVFQPNQVPDPVVVKPRNVIVQWEAPNVNIRKEIKYLGVVRANPVDYVSRFGAELRVASQLPRLVLDIKTPNGLVLACDYIHKSIFELEGDIHALNLIDLDKEGLSEYRKYLKVDSQYVSNYSSNHESEYTSLSELSHLFEQFFRQIDFNNTGFITLQEAERILLGLNNRLNRNFGEEDATVLLQTIKLNEDGRVSFEEFRRAFLNSI